jgi:predicted PurR-regulated permease PerM
MSRDLQSLIKINLILLLFFLVFGGLYIASTFLIPLAYAAILAMLLVPLCQRLEDEGVNRMLATLISIVLMVSLFLGLATLLSNQIANFVQDLPEIEKQFGQRLSKFQQFIQDTFGISPQEQEEAVQGDSSQEGTVTSVVIGFLGSFTTIMLKALLILVYLFMLVYYRSRFSKFILKVVSDDKKEKARQIISDSSQVAQQYLTGRGILIVILAVMYSIGLLIIGIDNAILLAVLAALVSIIPYIGNIIGVAFPLLMALAQGGDLWLFVGILLVFLVVQFIESYILEPYIVGAEVDIHPFFTIVVIIAGELIWGISGMILAIPLLGILKIIMENIDSLKPYAYLIGNKDGQNNSSRIKQWFLNWKLN